MTQAGTKVEYQIKNTTRLYPVYVAVGVFLAMGAYDIYTNGWDAIPSIRPWEENSFGPILQGAVLGPALGYLTYWGLKRAGWYGDSLVKKTTTTVMKPETTVKTELVFDKK